MTLSENLKKSINNEPNSKQHQTFKEAIGITQDVKEQNDKLAATEKLFKAIFGEMISTEYEVLTVDEVVYIAQGAIDRFAKSQGLINILTK